ncbi:hypothetical protein Hamer_G027974 [Homarus americanus]|uniref:Uncharacterized protein n=1 Tax=Homarus americanus TaxID=6706 RepID=A0A8J5K1S5_HOMAM|nr:hypothetical protein Hamer_G027974 [Homarus americanus]
MRSYPYWATNSAGKTRAVINTNEFFKQSTRKCARNSRPRGVAATVYVIRSISGTACWLTTPTMTAEASSWTGSCSILLFLPLYLSRLSSCYELGRRRKRARATTTQGQPRHKDNHDTRTTTTQGQPRHKDNHDTRTTTTQGQPRHKDNHDIRTTGWGQPRHKDNHDTGTTTTQGRPRQDNHNIRTTTTQGQPRHKDNHDIKTTTTQGQPRHKDNRQGQPRHKDNRHKDNPT